MIGDILLADRAPRTGATVLAHTGKPFDAGSIGCAVAPRAIMVDLRAGVDGPLAAVAARRRFARRIARVFFRCWTGSWCGWGG